MRNRAGHLADTVRGALDYIKEAKIEGARYEHTGGNIWCILVPDPRGLSYPGQPDVQADIYFGTAEGCWGWSDEFGDMYGNWEDLDIDCDGNELGCRIHETLVDIREGVEPR